jgi:hypothetical protein
MGINGPWFDLSFWHVLQNKRDLAMEMWKHTTRMIDAGTWRPRLSAATPLPLERPEIVVQKKIKKTKKFSNPFFCKFKTNM